MQSIRTNDHGLVSFQFMIPMSTRGPKASMKEGKIGFVEFLVSPVLSSDPGVLACGRSSRHRPFSAEGADVRWIVSQCVALDEEY